MSHFQQPQPQRFKATPFSIVRDYDSIQQDLDATVHSDNEGSDLKKEKKGKDNDEDADEEEVKIRYPPAVPSKNPNDIHPNCLCLYFATFLLTVSICYAVVTLTQSFTCLSGPYLYISHKGSRNIQKFSRDGCLIHEKVLWGITDQDASLRGMSLGTFQGGEALYVADSNSDTSGVKVFGQCFDSTSLRPYIDNVVTFANNHGALHAYGIAVDGLTGDIYASFQDTDAVLRFRAETFEPYPLEEDLQPLFLKKPKKDKAKNESLPVKPSIRGSAYSIYASSQYTQRFLRRTTAVQSILNDTSGSKFTVNNGTVVSEEVAVLAANAAAENTKLPINTILKQIGSESKRGQDRVAGGEAAGTESAPTTVKHFAPKHGHHGPKHPHPQLTMKEDEVNNSGRKHSGKRSAPGDKSAYLGEHRNHGGAVGAKKRASILTESAVAKEIGGQERRLDGLANKPHKGGNNSSSSSPPLSPTQDAPSAAPTAAPTLQPYTFFNGTFVQFGLPQQHEPNEQGVRGLVWVKNYTELWIANEDLDSIVVVDRRGRLLATINIDRPIGLHHASQNSHIPNSSGSSGVNPYDDWVFVGSKASKTGNIFAVDIHTRSIVRTFQFIGMKHPTGITSFRDVLFVGDQTRNTVVTFNITTARVIKMIIPDKKIPGAIEQVILSPC